MAEKKPYDSIIDAFLADREPDWKDLDLKDAKNSGEEVLDRTHQYVDEDFMDEIAESASRHTPVPPSKSATLQNRLYEKEKAAPMVNSVPADWRKSAQRSEDYKNSYGDNDSLMDEVAMSLETAEKEGTVEKKQVSDSAIQSYIKSLLNQGMAPSKVAAKLEKLAELELFNHQMATDYLQRNAGMLGLAYLEPNTYMDKENPNYRHNAAVGDGWVSGKDINDKRWEGVAEQLKTMKEQSEEIERKMQQVKQQRHGSNDCVRQHNAFKQAGIKPIAKSVKQVKACSDCSYFKKDASGKRCNLYHLPVVANANELSQIVNQLTPGVPNKMKHAALVQIANRTDEHVQPTKVASQTNIVKTADAHVDHQAARVQQTQQTLTATHVAKLHEKGVALKDIYKWADKKFGSVETSVAFRGFVTALRKNEKGKIVVAAADLKFLNSIGIRSDKFESGSKCASCSAHYAREARPMENDRGAMRVEGKFASRTMDVVRGEQKIAGSNFDVKIASKVVEKCVANGETIASVYRRVSEKVGSVKAKQAITHFVNNLKNTNAKIALSQLDCSFLKNKLGVHNAIIGAAKCGDCMYRSGMHCGLTGGTLLGYPGMNSGNKQASAENVTDGHAILGEYELTGAVQGPDIDTSGPERLDVETKTTFSLDE